MSTRKFYLRTSSQVCVIKQYVHVEITSGKTTLGVGEGRSLAWTKVTSLPISVQILNVCNVLNCPIKQIPEQTVASYMIINILVANGVHMWPQLPRLSPLLWILWYDGDCRGIAESCFWRRRKFEGKKFHFMGFIRIFFGAGQCIHSLFKNFTISLVAMNFNLKIPLNNNPRGENNFKYQT